MRVSHIYSVKFMKEHKIKYILSEIENRTNGYIISEFYAKGRIFPSIAEQQEIRVMFIKQVCQENGCTYSDVTA